MSKHPALTGKAIISALKGAGFIIVRTRGSHVFLRQDDGRTTVIPIHSGETIGQGLLSKILRDVDMTRDELQKLIKK